MLLCGTGLFFSYASSLYNSPLLVPLSQQMTLPASFAYGLPASGNQPEESPKDATLGLLLCVYIQNYSLLPGFHTTHAILYLLSHPFWQQKGGVLVETIFSFLVSVMASIVAYYVCKWLDRNDSDNQPKKSPELRPLGIFPCVPVDTFSFLPIGIIAYADSLFKYSLFYFF